MWQVIGQLRVICGYIQKLPYRCISKCKASPTLRRVGDLGWGMGIKNIFMSLRQLFYKQLSERTKVHEKGKWNVGTHALDIPCGENLFSIIGVLIKEKTILEETSPKSL